MIGSGWDGTGRDGLSARASVSTPAPPVPAVFRPSPQDRSVVADSDATSAVYPTFSFGPRWKTYASNGGTTEIWCVGNSGFMLFRFMVEMWRFCPEAQIRSRILRAVYPAFSLGPRGDSQSPQRGILKGGSGRKCHVQVT